MSATAEVRRMLAVEYPMVLDGRICWFTLISEEDDGWGEIRLRERLKAVRSMTCGQLRVVRRTTTIEILPESTVQRRGR